MAKPPREWPIDKTNPAAPLTGPSIASVPFLHAVLGQMSPLATVGTIQRDDIVATEVRSAPARHRIEFAGSASIDGVQLKFNPAESEAYLKRAITMQLGMQTAMGGEAPPAEEVADVLQQRTPEGKALFARMRTELENQLGKAIERNWPQPLEYSDNVTITTFKSALFRGDPLYEALLKGRGLNIVAATNMVQMSNPELLAFNIKNASISLNNLAMLLDTSVELTNFRFDGRLRDVAELRRFVLIVLAGDRVHVVVLRKLVGLGGTEAEADTMREVFESFRLLRGNNS